ncbi:response regulator [bacterium]|nr:response regulator [bacterium]
MTKLAETWGGCRVVQAITIALLFIFSSAEALVLQDVRLGLTENRTRIVYQFDRSSIFELSYDSSIVKLTIEGLDIPDKVLNEIRSLEGGLLVDHSYVQINGKTIFELRPRKEFHVRYFELVEPQRLVIDLYPKQAVEAAGLTPKKEAPKEEPRVEPVEVKKDTRTDKLAGAVSKPEEPVEVIDTTRAADGEKVDAALHQSPGELPPTTATRQGNGLNLLYILLPALIVVLLLIGITALRRASKRAKMQERKPYDNNEEDAFELKLEKLTSEESQTERIDETGVEEKEESEEDAEKAQFSYFPETPTLSEDESSQPEAPEGEQDDKRQPLHAPDKESEPDYDPANERNYVAAEPVIDPEAPEVAAAPYRTSVSADEKARRLMHKIEEEKEAELDFETGILTWPVHILDGDRHAKIMIVDDEVEIVSALEEYLTREHHEVMGISDPASALIKYASWLPDLLIMDVVMPHISGIEFIQQITEQHGEPGKVIFLSGRTERDTVAHVFSDKLNDGSFEFFRKPLSFVQILGRIRDYFSEAQFVLKIDINDAATFKEHLKPLTPHQLVAIQQYLWSKIFDIASDYLGRRIEEYYITDRMEPPTNYMRRVGCQEREDYCIANICFGSNPTCAADKIRGELEIMRQILAELRIEYQDRLDEEAEANNPRTAKRRQRRAKAKDSAETAGSDTSEDPPPRKPLRRLVSSRNR